MPIVIVIFTAQEEIGRCNAFELYKIIEDIAPNVLFEDLQAVTFNTIYKEHRGRTLQSVAIQAYLKVCPMPHIPVDTYSRPEEHEDDCHSMYKTICNHSSIDAFHFRNLTSNMEVIKSQYGLPFLNSDSIEGLFNELDTLKTKVLLSLDNATLIKIAQLEKETLQHREHQMLNTIYQYTTLQPYDTALLFMDAAHRQSFIKKVKVHKPHQATPIEWRFYGD